MSENQKLFLKKEKNKNIFIFLIQISIVIIFFVTWELLVKFNLINPFIYSSPSRIINTIKTLYLDDNLFLHIITTLYETLIAFTLGLSMGFIIAILLYQFKTLSKIVDPFLTMLNSLPKVALGPLIIIIFGANQSSVIFMALLINLIVVIITMYNGFLNTDIIKVKLFKVFNASNYQILTKLIIPSSFTTLISSLKLNISMSLIGQ